MENVKRERFLRIAESRTNNVLKAIQILANCSNRSSYEYSDEDVKKIFRAIESELKKAKERFMTTDQRTFKLRQSNE